MSDTLSVRMIPVDSMFDIQDMLPADGKDGSEFVPEPFSRAFVRLEGAVGLPEFTTRVGFHQRPLVEGFSEGFYHGFLSGGDTLPVFSGGLVSLYRVLKKTSLESILDELGREPERITISLVEAWLVLRRFQRDKRSKKGFVFYIPNRFGMVCEVIAARYQVGWFLMSRETSLRVGNGSPPGGRFALPPLKIENGLERDQLVVCSYEPMDTTSLLK